MLQSAIYISQDVISGKFHSGIDHLNKTHSVPIIFFNQPQIYIYGQLGDILTGKLSCQSHFLLVKKRALNFKEHNRFGM